MRDKLYAMFTKTYRSALVFALCISLAACTSDQITTTLEAAVEAAIAADTIARPADRPYLDVTQGCLDAAVSILASTQAPAVKAGLISSICAAAVAAESNAPVTVQAVSAALNAFLRVVAQTSAAIQFSNPAAVNAFLGAKAAQPSRKKLRRIREKLDALKARRAARR